MAYFEHRVLRLLPLITFNKTEKMTDQTVKTTSYMRASKCCHVSRNGIAMRTQKSSIDKRNESQPRIKRMKNKLRTNASFDETPEVVKGILLTMKILRDKVLGICAANINLSVRRN